MNIVFESMGTVVSLTGEPTVSAAELRVRELFAAADRRYSLYTPTSELSLIAAGQIRLDQASEELREMYLAATVWGHNTGGAFTAHRPDGVIDLSGIVKAWAMQRASEELHRAGAISWCLNVGGDVLTSGTAVDGECWTMGIVDPSNRDQLLCGVEIDPHLPAIATSGSAERGEHIWRTADPFASRFHQVTVAAHDIITADALATAIIAGGPSTLNTITDRWPIDVLAVDTGGDLFLTPGMREAHRRFASLPQSRFTDSPPLTVIS